MHIPNHFEVYRTSKECCEVHFPNSANCLQESKDSHDRKLLLISQIFNICVTHDQTHALPFLAFSWPIHFPGTDEHRPFAPDTALSDTGTEASHGVHYFPDLINKLNCGESHNVIVNVWGNKIFYQVWRTFPLHIFVFVGITFSTLLFSPTVYDLQVYGSNYEVCHRLWDSRVSVKLTYFIPSYI